MGLVVAVFAVADGTDGEDYVNVGTMTAQQVDDTEQIVGTFIDGQFLFLEEGGWALLAVVDNLARLLQAIDVVGAKGEEDYTGEPPPTPLQPEGEPTFHLMQHRGRIIHGAVGIDRSPEAFLHKPLADAVGKAGTYEEHFLARLHQETRIRDVYDCPKLHLYN